MYNYIFYGFYCLMLKKDVKAFSRASLLLSNVITFYLVSILLLIFKTFEIRISPPIIAPIVMIGLFLLSYYLNESYFIRNKKYSLIKEQFSEKTKGEKRIMSLISLFLYISSIVIFIFMGIQLGRYYNPY